MSCRLSIFSFTNRIYVILNVYTYFVIVAFYLRFTKTAIVLPFFQKRRNIKKINDLIDTNIYFANLEHFS